MKGVIDSKATYGHKSRDSNTPGRKLGFFFENFWKTLQNLSFECAINIPSTHEYLDEMSDRRVIPKMSALKII